MVSKVDVHNDPEAPWCGYDFQSKRSNVRDCM